METKQYLSTNEFAIRRRVKTATINRSYCMTGNYLGVVPKKIVSGALLWPADEVDRALSGVSIKG